MQSADHEDKLTDKMQQRNYHDWKGFDLAHAIHLDHAPDV